MEQLCKLAYIAIFFPMVAAPLVYLVGKKNKEARDTLVYLVCGLELSPLLFLFVMGLKGVYILPGEIPGICGLGLSFDVNGFHALYGMIAGFMWFMTVIFSRQYFAKHYHNRNRYYFFLLVTLGATEGVFFSADFFTTFLFFEMMSFTSFVWVAHDERKESLRAANTYLAVAVIGGLVMLMGIFLLYSVTGGYLAFNDLRNIYYGYAGINAYQSEDQIKVWAAGICILFGFGAKAGAFPLHIWLPKAHPVAPAPASALLSGVLTKAGMFGILILSADLFLRNAAWGILILELGVATMVVGAVLALFSVDLKRILACSSVSQIGFILVGVGMAVLLGEHNALAARGSILHMVNHSLLKLTLFMAAGVVYMNVHKLNLNDIRGFGRKKPLLNYIFLMGAFGIGGVPLWNGYVSKTLIHESIVEYMEILRESGESGMLGLNTMHGVEWAFLLSGGLTVAYMAKLYVALFLEKNSDPAVQKKFDALQGTYMNKASGITLAICATLLPVLGFFPNLLMGKLADVGQSIWNLDGTPSVAWFSLGNLKGAFVSLTVGVAVYFLVVRLWMIARTARKTVYVDRWLPYLDLEYLIYRPILLRVLPFLLGIVCRVLDGLVDTAVVLLRKTLYRDSKLPAELEEGTEITHLTGMLLNALEHFANNTIWKEKPHGVDYEHKLALVHEDLTENRFIIARSLSFGLLLFCLGLILTVAYMLIVH